MLIDRVRRQPLLASIAACRAFLALVVAWLLATGRVGPMLYGTVLLSLSLNRVYLATNGAVLPHVVEDGDLLTLNSVASTGGSVAALVGGALGAALTRRAGGDVVEAAAAVMYVAASLGTASLPRGLLGPDRLAGLHGIRAELAGLWHGVAAGARVIAARGPIKGALAVIFLVRMVVGLLFVSALLLFRSTFGTREGGLVLVLAATAAGTLAAALATPVLGRRWPKRRIIRAGLVLGAGALLAVVPTFGSLPALQVGIYAAAVVLGFAAQAIKIAVDTLIQQSVTDAFRGRVFAAYDILYNCALVAAAALAVLVVPPSGRAPGIYVLSGLALGAAALLERPGRSADRAPATAA